MWSLISPMADMWRSRSLATGRSSFIWARATAPFSANWRSSCAAGGAAPRAWRALPRLHQWLRQSAGRLREKPARRRAICARRSYDDRRSSRRSVSGNANGPGRRCDRGRGNDRTCNARYLGCPNLRQPRTSCDRWLYAPVRISRKFNAEVIRDSDHSTTNPGGGVRVIKWPFTPCGHCPNGTRP